ncbi:hypothetical protein [Halorubrum amylolyticum]|uniref:hypothetical protein n=1 Tax=Halorubrum amylolyticum TaxID=2508724 RepID=UPI0013E8B8E5|nr:hypothetical protein [Halorubrum amylolyticum]
MASDDEFANTAGEDGWMFVRVVAAHEIANLVGGLAGWAVRVDGDVVAFVELIATDLAPRVARSERDKCKVAAIGPEAV